MIPEQAAIDHLFLSKILFHFFPKWTLSSFEPIDNGLINQTFRVTLQQEQLQKIDVLQCINQKVFKAPLQIMENIQKVAAHLKTQSYHGQILMPRQTTTGQLFHIDEHKQVWRVYNYIQNTLVFNRVEKAQQAYEGANAFGHYLSALWTFDPQQLNTTIPNFHYPQRRYKVFCEIHEDNPHQRRKLARTAIEFIQQQVPLLNRFSNSELPVRVSHNDTKINNILFDKTTKKGTCIIDLDTLMPGHLPYDFGDMVRTFTNRVGEEEQDWTKVRMNFHFFEHLCKGFFDALGHLITSKEKEHLVDGALLITYEQSIRFLGDYIAGDLYYTPQYSGQNLNRAYNQIQLLRSMLEQESAMKNVIQQL